ncbi:MAG: cytochrome c3 family protein [Thermodesulfovibrionales bacterium]|jgi:predicted CXXCH cytochrome family protein
MKKIFLLTVSILLVLGISTVVFSDDRSKKHEKHEKRRNHSTETTSSSSGTATTTATSGGYVAIGWNDLGMHCLNPSFKELALLPPYNTLMVQIIERGDSPKIVTSGVTVEYALVNNTTVVGKSDFWQYVEPLFGVALPVGIGLTGNGLSGTMVAVGNHFEATGIPALPFDDSMTWNPYQRAIVKVKNTAGTVIASTEVVIPVSDEMDCQKCHASGKAAAKGMNGTLESNILQLHDQEEGTTLMQRKPVLCAECHSDNALGAPGKPDVSSLSLAMHGKHMKQGKNTPGCYDCHPGKNTKCNRSGLEDMGAEGTKPNCEKCHGDLEKVTASIVAGRNPWFEEPSCTKCHDSKYSTGKALYRQSNGHGGVMCATCHNSPHAWWPSQNPLDNVQPVALQGKAGSIGKCTVCHTNNPGGDNPHEADH